MPTGSAELGGVAVGVKMITGWRFFISTSNFGKNNQDPAKDPRIPGRFFFGSIHNGARPRHLARARLRHLARREVSVQVRARRLREHEVVRGVVGAHPSFWTRSSSTRGSWVCSRGGRQVSLVTAITQDTLVKTQSLFRVCVVVLSSITSRSVRRRGESLVGVRVHHSCWLSLTPSLLVFSEYRHCLRFLQSVAIALCFFCWFSQSTTIACVSVFF